VRRGGGSSVAILSGCASVGDPEEAELNQHGLAKSRGSSAINARAGATPVLQAVSGLGGLGSEPSGAPEPPRPGSSWPSRTTQRRCSGPGAAGCDGEEGGVTQADGRRSPPRRSRALRRYTGLRPRSGAGRRTNDAPFARSAADRLWRRWRRYRRMLVTVGVRRQRLEVFG
jgi:hypothetical protein